MAPTDPAIAAAARPREAAARVLARVLSDRTRLDLAIEEASSGLDGTQRAWLQDVSSGVLRLLGRLDLALAFVSEKRKPTGWLRRMLLVGAYQIIAQDRVSPATVVSETVDAIKRREGGPPSGFANAALRKISADREKWQSLPEGFDALPAVEQAAWASLPQWVWDRLVAQRGIAWAKEFAVASLTRPSIWVRTKVEGFDSELDPGPVPGSARFGGGGSVDRLDGWKEGRVFVQDVSSQLLVHEFSSLAKGALFDARRPGRALSALDLCAAPGGKSAGLSWNGFQVTATDRDTARFGLLKETVERVAPGAVRLVPFDAVPGLDSYDFVWVDAPCSSIGLARRHPDVRWLRFESELDGLARTQLELLRLGWKKVRTGGFLAYSVCSVLAEEGAGVLASLHLEGRVEKEFLLAPHLSPGGDGFYGALVRKPE